MTEAQKQEALKRAHEEALQAAEYAKQANHAIEAEKVLRNQLNQANADIAGIQAKASQGHIDSTLKISTIAAEREL